MATKNAQTTAPKLVASSAILNSLFKAYEPTTRAAPLPKDPTLQRREKFVRAVREQLALLEDANYARVIKRPMGRA
jgi:hypothetical protein